MKSPYKRNDELTKWALYTLYQSLLCAFGCNLKRRKRAGRRTKSMKINGKKLAKGAVRKSAIFCGLKKIRKFVRPHSSSTRGQVIRFFGTEGVEPGEGIAEDRRTRGSWQRSRSAGREGPTSGSPAIKINGCTILPSSFLPWVVWVINTLNYCKRSQGFFPIFCLDRSIYWTLKVGFICVRFLTSFGQVLSKFFTIRRWFNMGGISAVSQH